MKKDLYILYSEGTNNDNRDDVAIVDAESLEEAISKFIPYSNASSKNVKKIDLYPKTQNMVQGIQIVSKY